MKPPVAEENVADVVWTAHRTPPFGRSRQIANFKRHLRVAEVERCLLGVRRLLVVVPDKLAAAST